MSKQKSAESKSTSGSAQAWAQPYAASAVNQVQDVVNQNQPGLQQLTDLTHSQVVNPLLSKFQGSLGGAGQAQDYYKGVLNGSTGAGNPYLQNTLNQLNRGVGDQVNSQFEQSGRYGSGAHADVLSRNLSDADSNHLYQNYSDEMGRQGQAAAALAGGNNADIASLMGAIGQNAQLPYTGTSNLANSLGALFNGGTQTNVQYSPNPLLGALGAGLGAFGQVFQGSGTFSDRRLKTNITKVGEFPDGLGIYEYNYRDGHELPKNRMRGVMADEVESLRPWALGPITNGYATVDYSRL